MLGASVKRGLTFRVQCSYRVYVVRVHEEFTRWDSYWVESTGVKQKVSDISNVDLYASIRNTRIYRLSSSTDP